MATLYITNTGFRFPYPKWTNASTIQNLQFLEAQLGQYLHSHEDDGTTLWVTPQGFRMPYKKTRDNLEENMKFVEVQLEKYLHDHEVAVTELGCEPLVYGSNILRDPGFELHASNGFDNYGVDGEDFAAGGSGGFASLGALYWDAERPVTELAASDPYYDDAGWSVWETYDPATYPAISTQTPTLSTANPRSGTHHLRYSLPDSETFSNETEISVLGGQTCTEGYSYGCRVQPGDSITFSGHASVTEDAPAGTAGSWFVYQTINYYDDTYANIGGSEYKEAVLSTGSYQQLSNTVTVPANAHIALLDFGVYYSRFDNGAFRADFDDFVLNLSGGTSDEASSTLYINDAGFRFPYGWEKDGDININMKFLETEISKYLHKHEEGT